MISVETFLDGKKIVIKNLPLDNKRKFNFLLIFLDSKKSFAYCVEGLDLVITFKINDPVIIGELTENIITLINNCYNTHILTDSLTKNSLNMYSNNRLKYEKSRNHLSKIKEDGIEKNQDFKEFCKFCDDTLYCKLRPYQYTASFFLTIGNGGFDFSVPGSGKTIISYATYNYFKKKYLCDSILIIGPINSVNAWEDEYITCFDKNPDFISLTDMTNNEVCSYLSSSVLNHNEITFINVDKARRFKNRIIDFMEKKKTLLIIDEGHKEKNPEAEITKAVLEITKFTNYRIILTGTPMPNGYEDLYTLTKIYEPYERILPFDYGNLKKMTKNGAKENEQLKIMNSIKPFYSRVSKAFLINTGEIMPSETKFIKCEFSEEQKSIYNFLDKLSFEIENNFESLFNKSLMKAILIRKMQVSANPGLLSNSIINTIEECKEEYLHDFNKEDSENEKLIKADNEIQAMISQSPIINLINRFFSGFYEIPKNNVAIKLALELVKEGKKVIIWDVFVQNMQTIKKTIAKISNVALEMINGSVCGQERQNALKRFKYGKSMILIANPATLAESISLHRVCQNAIYVNRNFNAAQFIQSKDRIHRINMPIGTTATYYFVINVNSVDEAVNDRLDLKEKRMLRILDSDELLIGGSEFENDSFMSEEDIYSSYNK